MNRKHAHFVGIGGIGVSALAQWYGENGWMVSGSDLAASEITAMLQKEGIPVAIGPHRKENIPPQTSLLIYSAAAKKNPEVASARRKKIKVQSYAEAIGDLTRRHLTIAVAGSHGKSTTTALIACILIDAGFDPTVIIGTKLREFTHPADWRTAWLSSARHIGRNFRKGKTPVLVLEADEWDRSFLHYTPSLAVVTNVDKEHLDCYRTYAGVAQAFSRFLRNTLPGAPIIINADDTGAVAVAKNLLKKYPKIFAGRIRYYSLASPDAALLRPHLRIPGKQNASNAAAAAAVAEALAIPQEITRDALGAFEGAWRRFETIGKISGAPVIADYAHHPTEIHATIAAARERFGKKKLIAVFQPHHYERTRDLFHEFAAAFDEADSVALIDIYGVAGREKRTHDTNIHSFALARSVADRGRNAYYLASTRELNEFLHQEADNNAIILMMGAGSIWNIANELVG